MGATAWKDGSEASAIGGGWQNAATNVLTADGDGFSHDGSYNAGGVRVAGFGFSGGDIPPGQDISGIEVRALFYDNNSSNQLADGEVSLDDTGTPIGSSKARSSSFRWLGYFSASYVSYGGVQDAWGTALDTGLIYSSGFGVRIGFAPVGAGGRAGIMHVQMRLHYTEPLQQDFFVKTGGVWKAISPLYVKHGGVWKDGQFYVRHGGVWKKVYGT